MSQFSLGRAALLMAAGCAAFAALTGRVAYLQTYGREITVRQAERQQHRQQILPARRGGIFDRNGVLMAGTIQSKVLFADPKFMMDEFQARADEELKARADAAERRARGKATSAPTTKSTQTFPGRYAPWDGVGAARNAALTEVADLVGIKPADLIGRVDAKQDSEFVKLAVRVSDDTADAIAKLKIPGIGFLPMPVRNYPMEDLASHILGGISSDGVGLDGLEQKYDRVLNGRDGFLKERTDSRGRPIETTEDDFVAPVHGEHLVLTIDANIQMIAEQELRATIEKFSAKRGEVVVMNPWTGEVLALANYPTYRTEDYLASADADKHRVLGDPPAVRNSALVAPYEPGSTIKPFIASPALQWKVTRVGEMFDTHNGHYTTSYGRGITDVHEYSRLALWDVLVKSSNIGMALLGERLGNAKLREALSGFEFGRPTGIELPGESGGVLYSLPNWTKYSTESVSQGYEVMVTPLQLARGMCAIANGGQLLRPTIVKGVVDDQGEVTALPNLKLSPGEGRQVLEPETAAQVRRVLADVLVRGTGMHARSDLYNVFGKTGTAHLTEPGKKVYSQDKYTSSFIGAAPYEHPQLVVAFIIHEAKKSGKNYYGGTTAAPGAVQTLERSLRYLGVEPSPKLAPPPPEMVPLLYNYSEKAYSGWPDNIRKERGEPIAPKDGPPTPPSPDDDTVPPMPTPNSTTPPGQPAPTPPDVRSVG
jgi:cell division protein FtsI (penicillin-binding protein 3)